MSDQSSATLPANHLAIMRAVMDGVVWRSEPEAGTVVHLVKTLRLGPDGPMGRLLLP